MWTVAGIFAVGILFALVEVPSLRNRKLKREMAAFFSLLFIGVGLGIAQSKQINIPNPLDWISMIYKPVSDWLMSILK